jgi:ABC-2 type transport system ATP-binding protein
LRADSGMAHIFGRNCWKEGQEIRRDVGYVAGDVRLYPWLTTRRALSMLSKIRHRELRATGFALAERFQLEPDLPVRKMSRGNRQKLALVLALAHTPKLVILDEPTTALDPLMQDELMLCLRDMVADGRTVLFSSHTLSEVESLCDHVVILRDGRIVEDSTVSRLKAQAPRQIVVTLSSNHTVAAIQWPENVTLCYLPGMPSRQVPSSTAIMVPVELRDRTCVIELIGTSVPFMKWAAVQNFADIIIGPPSLEVLFRRYYQSPLDSA